MEPDGMSASANKAGLPVASAEAVSGVHGSEDTPMVPVVLIEEDEANDPPEPPSSAAFNTTGTHNTSGEFKKKPGLRRSSNPTTGTGTGTNSGTPDTVRAAVAPAVAKHGLAARRPSSQQTTTRIPDPPDHEYDSHSTDFHEGLVPQPPAARPPMATPNSVMEVPRAPSGNVFTDTMIHYKTEAMNHEENDEENPPIVEENLLSPPTDPKSATDKTASLSIPLSEKQDSKKSISEDTVAVPKVWIWTCLVLIILVGGIGAAVGITLKVSNNDSESTPTTTTTTTATSSSSESLPATVGPIATTQLTDSGPTANDLDPLDTTTPAPTDEPVSSPAQEPTMSPTTEPTVLPTTLPTEEPTISPTISPTAEPTAVPTPVPTDEPVSSPTVAPTISVTDAPSAQPTSTNLDGLTPEQSTSAPTTLTTTTATATNPQTTVPTEPPNVSQPSTSPTGSESPSLPPSTAPTTQIPSANPSVTPTVGTNNPTTPPSTMPPTAKPTTPSPTTSTINIPSNPTGTSESSIPCSTNENCASGICINNQCAQDFLSDFELCQEDEDCEFDACRANGTSPGSSTTEETLGTKICCPNGMVSQDSRVCGGLPTGTYCRDIDTGFSYNSLYQSEANSICASGICVNDVCVESLQPHSSPCTENADCSSDICVEDVCLSGALADFAPCTENADCGSGACRANGTSPGRSTTVETLGLNICCPNGIVSEDSRVCGGLPIGSYCRDIDTGFSYNSLYQSEANSICASGICINDICSNSLQPDLSPCTENGDCLSGICVNDVCLSEALTDFQACDENADCGSGACRANGTSPGRSNSDESLGNNICCPNGMVSQDSRICGGLPAGSACRDIDTGFSYNSLTPTQASSICASGNCIDDICV